MYIEKIKIKIKTEAYFDRTPGTGFKREEFKEDCLQAFGFDKDFANRDAIFETAWGMANYSTNKARATLEVLTKIANLIWLVGPNFKDLL